MSKSTSEPLGVPRNKADQHRKQAVTRKNSPTALDRWLLSQIEKRLVNVPLCIQLWDQPTTSGNAPTVTVHDRGALIKLILNPELEFGDLYSSGRIDFFGNFDELMESVYGYVKDTTTFARLIRRLRRLAAPDLVQSRRNIHHHYDIGNDFYKLWLDEEAMQYTCAYYPSDSMDLETAQQEKMHHVCRKLWLKPGDTVVEAGCGWGGFALFMAQHYGANVRAFNISHEQILHAREWAKQKNLSDQVEFVEDDYRNVAGQYDAFVSIGMLEHVGRANYQELGKIMKQSLKQTGRGLVHSIGRDKTIPFNPWIAKRIFPGAYPPTLKEMISLFENSDLSVLDVENLRLHYAKTLKGWLDRYEKNMDEVRRMLDDTFVRAWHLYLAGSRGAFKAGSLQLFQILFTHSGFNEIPATRTRIYPNSHG